MSSSRSRPRLCRPSPSTIAALLSQDSLALFVLNGIPLVVLPLARGSPDDTRLPRLDPARALWDHIAPERIVGAVAYTACSIATPGVIHAENARNRIIIGRPDGRPDVGSTPWRRS